MNQSIDIPVQERERELFKREGYVLVTKIGDHGWCGIKSFMFTWAIISGMDRYGYEDRWCYHDLMMAAEAMRHWVEDPTAAEPFGWHRHPPSGRRRPDGDASREYVSR